MTSTLEAIEDALPNGLHDAVLRKMHLDYDESTAVFAVDVLVSTPDSDGPPKYRSLELTVRGMVFVAIDPPVYLPKAIGESLRIDTGVGHPSTAPIELPALPGGCFLHWLFVSKWNSFIRVAAREASYKWLDESS